VATIVESLRKAQLVQLEDETYVNACCDNVIEANWAGVGVGLDQEVLHQGRAQSTEREDGEEQVT